MEQLQNIDSSLFLYLNSLRSSFGDSFFMLFSGRFIWIPMYIAMVFTLFRDFSWRQALIFLLGVAVLITLTDQIGASVLRPYFGRPRPSHPDSPIQHLAQYVNEYRAGGFGFPSCHAANTVALATYFSLCIRRGYLTIFLSLWALVTCYSRIYLAAHYPGDLLAGSLLGFIIAILVYFAARLICMKTLQDTFINKEHFTHHRLAKSLTLNYRASNSIIIMGLLTVLYMVLISL